MDAQHLIAGLKTYVPGAIADELGQHVSRLQIEFPEDDGGRTIQIANDVAIATLPYDFLPEKLAELFRPRASGPDQRLEDGERERRSDYLENRIMDHPLFAEVSRLESGVFYEAPDRGVHITGLDLESVADASSPVRRQNCCPGAREPIEHPIPAARTIEDRIRHQPHGFNRGVHCERLVPLAPERVNAGVPPDVASVATVSAELDIIRVRRRPHFADVDELMLRAVERAHPGIRLHPDAKVFAFAVDGAARREELT